MEIMNMALAKLVYEMAKADLIDLQSPMPDDALRLIQASDPIYMESRPLFGT